MNRDASEPAAEAGGPPRPDGLRPQAQLDARFPIAYQTSVPARMDANFDQFAEWAGGVGQWAYTISLPEACVLHATVNKAHTFGGYIRYTADSRPTSETHSLGIMTYRNGRWGSAGGIGVMMYHDYTNDAR
jgi:hypothetical protein